MNEAYSVPGTKMRTSVEWFIKPKVGLLELAKQLGNVSQACKILTRGRLGHLDRSVKIAASMGRILLAVNVMSATDIEFCWKI